MKISAMVIEGEAGRIELTASATGVMVTTGHDEVCEFARSDDGDARYAAAEKAARVVYGTGRRGVIRATNSMIHDVLIEMERVAGC